ncbi:RNA polymerase sigma factor [Streptomyces sp. NBC_00568]|uniref:RNA polymerase sigma factor n=1 Tax=Streptomyces sp. NBC_00568 TaxID=2975779 RepID=UPI0022563DE9|nr:sigma-70 family RNA polymerase sigma factor [Streptomyces sp. NBC_00568]MCX4993521.1 sigma-70 family RNA polymerase sigma factor [Streptomyces sp. NBC_00568]
MSSDIRTQVRAGKPQAFAKLYEAYANTVYNHAFRLTANWAAAEDVMATTFMEAWRLHNKIDAEGGSLRPWLLGIATNTARNQYRSNRRYKAAVTAAAQVSTAVPDHADDVAGRLDDQQRMTAVLTALSSMRRPEREVLTLCLFEGLEYSQAAEALGIPLGTVRSRLSRARAKLKRLATTELTGRRSSTSKDAGEKRELSARRRQVLPQTTHPARPTQKGSE